MKFKELLKNKKFMIIAGIVGIIALIMFLTKNKTTETESVAEDPTYGDDEGYSGGSYSSPTETKVVEVPVNTDEVGQTPIVQAEIIDTNQYKQDVSNKIYDLKELYTKTKAEFGNNPNKDQNEILKGIHEEAKNFANSAGFTDISTNNSGVYQGIYTDTNKDYNAYTGEKQTNKGIEKVATDELKQRRIEAQKQILELKNKYALTSDKAEQKRIHLEAEKIGVMAGLQSGGDDGSKRKEVDLNTGEIIGG